MTEPDRLTFERLRDHASRLRKLAEVHDAFGEPQKAADCRALAALEEDRARRLERRGSAG